MKSLRNLIIVLAILTITTISSNGLAAGLMFFGMGAVIILIGSYTSSLLTSKQ